MSIQTILKRHSLAIGILLMFALTWPIDLANSGVVPVHLPFAVSIMVGWGLSIGALIVTGLTQGKDGAVGLLKRFLIWRVSWKWYLVAFLMFPAIFSLAVLLNAVVAQTPITFSGVMAYKIFGPSADLPLLILPFFLFDAITNGEEMGWRGYLLPRLQARRSPLIATLMLGVVWGFWHLPKYLGPGNTGPFAWFMIKILAEAILYTWLYSHTQGSLLLTTLFHAAGNTAGMFLPMANAVSGENLSVLIIAVAIEVSLAAVITVATGSTRLDGQESKALRETETKSERAMNQAG